MTWQVPKLTPMIPQDNCVTRETVWKESPWSEGTFSAICQPFQFEEAAAINTSQRTIDGATCAAAKASAKSEHLRSLPVQPSQ